METMEARDPEKVSTKGDRTRVRYMMAIMCDPRYDRAPWIMPHILSPFFDLPIYHYSMMTCEQVMPFPCLATEKG